MAAMAATRVTSLVFLVFVAPVALAAETAHVIHLNFFSHNSLAGCNPTVATVVRGPASSESSVPMSFGDMIVFDNPLTETSSAASAAIGRMEGFVVVSSQSGPILTMSGNLVLAAGDYKGSTIAIMGRMDDTPAAMEDASLRELPVVGGTGVFRKATGHVLWKVHSMDGINEIIELDVYVSMARRAMVNTCSSESS